MDETMTAEFQRKCEVFVRNEVDYCLSGWMDYAMDCAMDCAMRSHISCPVDIEDIPSSSPCTECKGTGYELCKDGECDDVACECSMEEGDPEMSSAMMLTCTEEVCGDCDEGQCEVDIFEWWAVSSYLAGKLEEQGEVVLEGEVWGRQTSGQSISIDRVIEDIVRQRG